MRPWRTSSPSWAASESPSSAACARSPARRSNLEECSTSHKLNNHELPELNPSPGFSLFTLSERRLSPAEAEVSSDVSEAPVTAEDGESGPFGINRTSFDISFELLFDMKGYLLLVEISSASGT